MALTDEAQARLAGLFVEELRGGQIEVSDGNGGSARAPIGRVRQDGNTAVAVALFGGSDAVFEWRERRVVDANGVVLDTALGDFGRKPLGTEWVVQVDIEMTAG